MHLHCSPGSVRARSHAWGGGPCHGTLAACSLPASSLLASLPAPPRLPAVTLTQLCCFKSLTPSPAAAQVSRFQFVDMPGAERLAMDPELLRLREGGQLSRSLLSFASVLKELADAGAAGVREGRSAGE